MAGSVFGSEGTFRLYGDLAWLFPILAPLEHSVEETRRFSDLLVRHAKVPVRTLLHLGCGGGQNDFVFKKRFGVTGVDPSEPMLEQARRLNPEVRYVRGDARSVRLGVVFEAVAAVDSLDYMRTPEDLRAAFATAWEHLAPGGVFFFMLETVRESFRQNRTDGWTAAAEGVELACVENGYATGDGRGLEKTLLYLIRRNGRLTIEHDLHLCGLFAGADVLAWLEEAGFAAVQDEYRPEPQTPGRPESGVELVFPLFIALKPPEGASP